MRYNIILSSFIFLFFCSCGQEINNNVKIRGEIRSIANAIARKNVVMSDSVGFVGKRTKQYDRFVSLKDKATIEELIQLTNHRNAVARCYSFQALKENGYKDLYPIVMKHISDNTLIASYCGDIIIHLTVGEMFILDAKDHFSKSQLRQLKSHLISIDSNLADYIDNYSFFNIVEIIEEEAKTKRKSLNLYDKNIVNLPPEIGNLTYLTELKLDNNQLSTLPPEIGKLSNLKMLSLENNHLTTLPYEISKLINLTFLDLDKNQLNVLPPAVIKLYNLTYLSLDNNQLTKLPPETGNLNNLKKLYLNNNQLTELPSTIYYLSNIETLYLDNNQLTELPSGINKLSNLSTFSLDNNLLTDLPSDFSKLNNLSTLSLGNNHLTRLPSEFVKMKNLKRLYIRNNKIPIEQIEELQEALPELKIYK